MPSYAPCLTRKCISCYEAPMQPRGGSPESVYVVVTGSPPAPGGVLRPMVSPAPDFHRSRHSTVPKSHFSLDCAPQVRSLQEAGARVRQGRRRAQEAGPPYLHCQGKAAYFSVHFIRKRLSFQSMAGWPDDCVLCTSRSTPRRTRRPGRSTTSAASPPSSSSRAAASSTTTYVSPSFHAIGPLSLYHADA